MKFLTVLIFSTFSGVFAQAQMPDASQAQAIQKLSTYFPGNPVGVVYVGVGANGVKCSVSSTTIRTAFEARLFYEPSSKVQKATGASFRLYALPRRFESTRLVAGRENPGLALQVASQWINVSQSGLTPATPSTDTITIVRQGQQIQSVTINTFTCANLQVWNGPAPQM